MGWKTESREGLQLTVIALPDHIKSQLIRRKALTRVSVTGQIVEALERSWSGSPGPGSDYRSPCPPLGVPMPVGGYRPPAVVPNPAVRAVGDLITSGQYKGMKVQRIGPTSGTFDPNAAPFT
jgi:hypothetical protein